MASKITIVGAGSVGATIAFMLSQKDFCSELVMIDILKDKAEGEATDIVQGTAFRNPIRVYSGDYEDAKDSDIVIITSGVARKPGQSRIDLAQTNVNIIRSIAPDLAFYAPDALYIMVANPVDIMTYAFIKFSGLPEENIIGSGTLLDTSRLRYGLSEKLKIGQRSIHAYVFGEHGDTSFIPWSCCRVASMPADDYIDFIRTIRDDVDLIDKDAVLEYVHKSGAEIIKRKGATFYGVSVAVVNLVEALLGAFNSIKTVSSMMHGEYGIDDVCLSCLTLIGPNGVAGKVPVELTEDEIRKMQTSADSLKSVINGLDI